MTRGVLAAPGELARGILSALPLHGLGHSCSPGLTWDGRSLSPPALDRPVALLQPRGDLGRALSQPSFLKKPGRSCSPGMTRGRLSLSPLPFMMSEWSCCCQRWSIVLAV